MVAYKLTREELNTVVGKLAYDYSPLPKEVLPIHICKEIAEAFFKRNKIDYFHLLDYGDIRIYVALGNASLMLYTEWRRSFYEHGYTAPVVHFTEKKE